MKRMTRSFLVGVAGLTTAVAAREMGVGNSLRLAVDTESRNVNGYAYQEPGGGSEVAPTLFVFSDDRLRYSRIGYRDKPANARLRATFECVGDWSHEGLGNPEIRIGRSDRYHSADRSGGGKPIYHEGTPFSVIATASLEELDLPASLDPVRRCNTVVEDYTLQGNPPGALLQNGFWIKVDDVIRVSLAPACTLRERRKGVFGSPPKFPPGFEGRIPLFIRCMPTGYVVTKGPPPREGKPAPPTFSTIELKAINSPLHHSCPATVVFRGNFHASRGVSGSYRFVGSDGYESPGYPFTLAPGADKSVAWQRRVEPSGKRGSLASAAGTSASRIVSGWLQLEVKGNGPNDQPHRSERANYQVACAP